LPPIKTNGDEVASFANIRTHDGIGFNNLVGEGNRSLLFPLDDTNEPKELEMYDEFEIQDAFLNAFNLEYQKMINQDDSGNIEYETVNFKNTSVSNNMLCQIFEVSNRSNNRRLVKLDVIERGVFHLDNSTAEATNQIGHEHKQVYFVGKVFQDDFGVPTFIRLFTVMFD
jgi:hypothetical protein